MLHRRSWLGLALACSCAALSAQESSAPPPDEQRLVAVETEATKAAAAQAHEEVRLAKQLQKSAKPAEVRAALRDTLAKLLTIPQREASAQIADALDELGSAAAELNDTECVVQAYEPVLAFRLATIGPDDNRVQVVRATLGTSYWSLGRLDRSKQLLGTALEWARTKLPVDDPRLFDAMSNYAVTLYYLDDCENARVMMTQVVDALVKKTGADDPEIQWAFANLGNILDKQGDVDGAVASRERVHRILSKSRPPDHADVMIARQNLALSLRRAGDPIAARTLLETLIEWDEKHYPPGHIAIERTRQNLALALLDIGDCDSARVMLEGIVERLEKRGLSNDPTLLNAKSNLCVTLSELHRYDDAAELAREVFEQRSAAFGESSLDTLDAKAALARQLDGLGRHDEAVQLSSAVVSTLAEKHPENEYAMLIAEGNLGAMLLSLGRSEEGTKQFERAFDIAVRRLGENHELTLHTEASLAGSLEGHDNQRMQRLLRDVGQRLSSALASAAASLSPREAELHAYSLAYLVDGVIAGCPGNEDAALGFELVETARLAAWAGTRSAAAVDRACSSNEDARQVRDALRSKSAQVAEFAQSGRREEYQRAALERGALERRLATSVAGFASATRSSAKPAQLAAHLPEGSAAISFRRYEIERVETGSGPVGYFVAFVLRRDGSVRRLELGPAAAIERALERWRAALGIAAAAADAQSTAGEELRAMLVDKLREATGGAKRWIVAPDDVLNLIPLDALPQGTGVVGDEIQIEVHTHLSEIAEDRAIATSVRNLVALGGIDFDAPIPKQPNSPTATDVAANPQQRSGVTPLTAERMPPRPARFAPLLASADEVAGVAGIFRARAQAEAEIHLLSGGEATKSALAELAPHARWLHIATHGFFAPETIASLDESAHQHAAFEREIRGLSPRVLCGLALAGANAPGDVFDRTRGVLTAEELAYLDLDGCELAVLSACDSSLGVRRGGQSVASLQSALHAAGARSAVTALWHVSDDATKLLMLAFYKGLWEEHLSKGDALWRAKNELRRHRAPTREWAAWVLTGDAR